MGGVSFKPLLQIPILNIAISSITLSELEFGLEKSLHKKQNKIALTDFISPLNILFYDDGIWKNKGGFRKERNANWFFRYAYCSPCKSY